MPRFSLPRRRARRRTPEPVERRLDRLLADPLYSERSDNEFRDFVARQFDRVFGTDPMEVDASGRGIDPRPRRTDIAPFRPKVRADDLRLGAPVGRGAANGFGDVLGLQKVLSKLGAYDFDIAEGEQSGQVSPRFIRAVKGFQEQNGLKVDGLANPGGPTIKTLGRDVFSEGKASASQGESAGSARPTLLGMRAKGAQAARGAGRPPAQARGPGKGPPRAQSAGTGVPPRTGTTVLTRGLGLPSNQPVDPKEVYKRLDFDPEGPGEKELALNDPVAAWQGSDLADKAEEKTGDLFPGVIPHNNPADAFRHALWSYQMTQELGPEKAKKFGDAHEISPPNPDSERTMDLYNNYIGRALALDPKNKGRPAEDVIMAALRNGLLQIRPLNISGPSPSKYDYYLGRVRGSR